MSSMGTHDHRSLLLAVDMGQGWMSCAPVAVEYDVCVPGRTAVFHRQDVDANSAVILCAVHKQHRFIPVFTAHLAASARFCMRLALQAVLDCLVRV